LPSISESCGCTVGEFITGMMVWLVYALGVKALLLVAMIKLFPPVESNTENKS
jgi:hypothetical protein